MNPRHLFLVFACFQALYACSSAASEDTESGDGALNSSSKAGDDDDQNEQNEAQPSAQTSAPVVLTCALDPDAGVQCKQGWTLTLTKTSAKSLDFVFHATAPDLTDGDKETPVTTDKQTATLVSGTKWSFKGQNIRNQQCEMNFDVGPDSTTVEVLSKDCHWVVFGYQNIYTMPNDELGGTYSATATTTPSQ